MDLFYVQHHYKSIVRSNSYGGEIFAFILIALFSASSAGLLFTHLDDFVSDMSVLMGTDKSDYSVFLLFYVLVDLILKLVFKRSLPKVHYYLLWFNRSKVITYQYMLTTLFGIVPFIFFVTLLVVVFKAGVWLGVSVSIVIAVWWITNHFLGLASQFFTPRMRTIMFVVILVLGAFQFFIPSLRIHDFMLHPIAAVLFLMMALVLAFKRIRNAIEGREFVEVKAKKSYLESLPTLSFKNPVLQLEWALIARNKRTRSNLLLGLISILFLPFVINEESPDQMILIVSFFITGFFIIQHGIYSFGWEGSYFDFLLVNIPSKVFLKARFLFYVGTCVIGLILGLISNLLAGINPIDLIMLFLYNCGVTIPFVLYRSVLNETKIDLKENSFMNYNGMLTGPIFLSSILVMIVPAIVYSLGETILGSEAIYIVGGVGVLGLVLYSQILEMLVTRLSNRKYRLSQSFKS